MTTYTRVAAVSGANKGIGEAIVRQLALASSSTNNGPLLIYLLSRDKARGQTSLDEMLRDKQLQDAKAFESTTVKLAELDISSDESIANFAAFLKKEHGQIDIFIGNAGIAMQGFNDDVVEKTLHTNYYGTLKTTEAILPLIKDGGRFVNVSSGASQLGKYSEPIRQRFLASKSVSDITALMEEFKSAVKAGKEKEKGWPSAAYAVSKAGVTGLTKVIAEQEKAKGSKTLINSCCPGFVVTDMTRGGGVKTPDQGAQTPVLLALGDIREQTGLFWQDERPINWSA